MPGFYEIRWLPDGPTERFAGSRGNYYEFEDGSHLDMDTTPAWCRHCGKVTHGEEIEPLAEIDKKLADLHDPDSELYRFTQRSLLPPELDQLMPRDKFRLDMIEKTEKRRRWREQRRAHPKCIRCGSTDIFLFPINQQVPHPAGAGTVEVSIVGMCSTSLTSGSSRQRVIAFRTTHARLTGTTLSLISRRIKGVSWSGFGQRKAAVRPPANQPLQRTGRASRSSGLREVVVARPAAERRYVICRSYWQWITAPRRLNRSIVSPVGRHSCCLW
ncbi:MAG TPA: hypothetical protein VGR35_23280 [Tepidisphaeraceae bacterium]|nr:hypothetical protein [Tepidisphaeraceae bacterium]